VTASARPQHAVDDPGLSADFGGVNQPVSVAMKPSGKERNRRPQKTAMCIEPIIDCEPCNHPKRALGMMRPQPTMIRNAKKTVDQHGGTLVTRKSR